MSPLVLVMSDLQKGFAIYIYIIYIYIVMHLVKDWGVFLCKSDMSKPTPLAS
jgi:hypothetical protein